MTSKLLRDEVTWRRVGDGVRAHAFNGGYVRYAFCTIGPGQPVEVASNVPRCATCMRRIERIEAQNAAWDAQD